LDFGFNGLPQILQIGIKNTPRGLAVFLARHPTLTLRGYPNSKNLLPIWPENVLPRPAQNITKNQPCQGKGL
jgi:hypothetical protein